MVLSATRTALPGSTPAKSTDPAEFKPDHPTSASKQPNNTSTLFGVVFFLIGIALFGIGLLGEYVGRIYAQVRERPRYVVEAVLELVPEQPAHDPPLGVLSVRQ